LNNTRFFLRVLLSACLLLLFNSRSGGQILSQEFGKNRIQYRKFDWQVLSSQSVDLYFYTGGETLAKTAIEITEQEFRRISELFGFTPFHKIKIFLCLSTNDRLMSNLGIGQDNFEDGGKTTFTKSIAEVAYEGSLSNLRKQIAAGVSQIMIRDMLFGGSLKEALQNSYLLNLPDWFIGGAIRYASEGSGPEMEDFMKELAGRKKIRQPANFVGAESYLIGQSIWNFIGERFGRSAVGNILNLTRILRNEEKAIVGSLGMPFSVFLREWRLFYLQMPLAGLSIPPENLRKGRNFLKKNYRNLCFTPDGEYLLYSCDWKGKFQVIRLDIKTGKTHVIFRGGSRFIQQNSEGEFPALCPVSNEQILIAYPQKGYWHGMMMNLNGSERRRLDWFKDFHEVNALRLSPGGKTLAVSGSLGAYSDIFLMSLKQGKLKRLTQDWYDDLDPFFSPEGDTLYFSSNRPVRDTVLEKPSADFKKKLAVFSFPVDNPGKKPVLFLQSSGNLTKGQFIGEGRVVCLDDEGGTRNVRLFESGKKEENKTYLSNCLFNIQEYSFNEEQQMLAYATRQHLRPALFLGPAGWKERSSPASSTDAARIKLNPDVFQGDSEKVDIRNYVFESEKRTVSGGNSKEVRKKERARFKKESQVAEIDIQGPGPYRPQMTANHLVTGLLISPVPTWGLGARMNFAMHDFFENHHINGGVNMFLSDFDFRNNTAFLEYQYLRNRIDLKVRTDRVSIQNSGLNQLFRQRDVLQQIGVAASYPFSNAMRFEVFPFVQETRRSVFDIRSIGLGGEDLKNYYFGGRAEFVFDNSIRTGMNLLSGTRFNLRAQYQMAPTASALNFGELAADFRSYLPIHREITLAVRASGGSFFGNAPKKYLLGGLDNWIFREYHVSRQKDDPLLGYRDDILSLNSDETQSQWLFNRYCTNLRGYRLNAAYGTRFMLFNWELRVPVIRYIYKGPINSNFWRNLQLVAFTDLGTAWTGKGPWNQDNSLNTKTISEGNFSIRVKSYENPFLAGYGFGLRTLVLGYFARLDVAWPNQRDADRAPANNPQPFDERNSSRINLSIGHDF